MVAAARGVEPGRAAEFARGHHQRRFQAATPFEVVDQSCERLIERGQQFAWRNRPGAEGGRAVAVPGDAVEDRLEHVDGDHPHAGLDQPAGKQTALAEGRLAILNAVVLDLNTSEARTSIAAGSSDAWMGPYFDPSQPADCPLRNVDARAGDRAGKDHKRRQLVSRPLSRATTEPMCGCSSPARQSRPV